MHTPQRCPREEKKAQPSRMHDDDDDDADPSKMVQGSFKPLWDGMRKMQILLGW
jgi:hypothetical protein